MIERLHSSWELATITRDTRKSAHLKPSESRSLYWVSQTRSKTSRLSWPQSPIYSSTILILWQKITSHTWLKIKSWWSIFPSMLQFLSRWSTHALKNLTASSPSSLWPAKATQNLTSFRTLSTSLLSYFVATSRLVLKMLSDRVLLTGTIRSSLRLSSWKPASRMSTL